MLLKIRFNFFEFPRVIYSRYVTQQTDNQEIFKTPKEAQIMERKRYRFSPESLNGFSIIPYCRKQPIQDIKMLKKAIEMAVLRSTNGKYDESKGFLFSQPTLKLRLIRELYKETGHLLPDYLISNINSIAQIFRYYQRVIIEMKRSKNDPPFNQQLFKDSNVHIEIEPSKR
ncbi:hypothetical protein PCANB_000767 [Pneumocystis canis]|nr:hypothetical protein PCANB_000767 [Pneumocystis canis]